MSIPDYMTLTAYLSGKRKPQKWHDECDSIAARLVITSKDLIGRILDELDFEEDDKNARWQFVDILADAASDDENQAVLDFLSVAAQFTNYIHVNDGERLD